MAEVIARVRKEMQERLEELEAELANVEALIAERAQIKHALASHPFATAASSRGDELALVPAVEVETAPAVADDVALVALDEEDLAA